MESDFLFFTARQWEDFADSVKSFEEDVKRLNDQEATESVLRESGIFLEGEKSTILNKSGLTSQDKKKYELFSKVFLSPIKPLLYGIVDKRPLFGTAWVGKLSHKAKKITGYNNPYIRRGASLVAKLLFAAMAIGYLIKQTNIDDPEEFERITRGFLKSIKTHLEKLAHKIFVLIEEPIKSFVGFSASAIDFTKTAFKSAFLTKDAPTVDGFVIFNLWTEVAKKYFNLKESLLSEESVRELGDMRTEMEGVSVEGDEVGLEITTLQKENFYIRALEEYEIVKKYYNGDEIPLNVRFSNPFSSDYTPSFVRRFQDSQIRSYYNYLSSFGPKRKRKQIGNNINNRVDMTKADVAFSEKLQRNAQEFYNNELSQRKTESGFTDLFDRTIDYAMVLKIQEKMQKLISLQFLTKKFLPLNIVSGALIKFLLGALRDAFFGYRTDEEYDLSIAFNEYVSKNVVSSKKSIKTFNFVASIQRDFTDEVIAKTSSKRIKSQELLIGWEQEFCFSLENQAEFMKTLNEETKVSKIRRQAPKTEVVITPLVIPEQSGRGRMPIMPKDARQA